MEKTSLAAGICILIIGVVIAVLPFVYVPRTVSEAKQAPKSEWILGGWTGMAAYASFKDAHKGTPLNDSDSLNIQANATADKHIDFSVRAINTSDLPVLSKCYHSKHKLDRSSHFRIPFYFQQHYPFHMQGCHFACNQTLD